MLTDTGNSWVSAAAQEAAAVAYEVEGHSKYRINYKIYNQVNEAYRSSQRSAC
jgi:hypothetical protein